MTCERKKRCPRSIASAAAAPFGTTVETGRARRVADPGIRSHPILDRRRDSQEVALEIELWAVAPVGLNEDSGDVAGGFGGEFDSLPRLHHEHIIEGLRRIAGESLPQRHAEWHRSEPRYRTLLVMFSVATTSLANAQLKSWLEEEHGYLYVPSRAFP